MSKRAVAQQAARGALAWRQGQSSVATRCFATSSTSQAPRRKERKRDANLRHAINLYHLTDFFFPTNKSTEQGKQSDTAYDKDLDSHIRFSIMGNSTTISPDRSNLDGFVDFRAAHPTLAKKIKDDEAAFNSTFGNSGAVSEDAAVNALKRSSQGINASRLEELPLPLIDDKEAVERYIAETARRAAAAGGLTDSRPGDNYDIRGAQVRDALFGTVGGVRPGLETIRERVKARKERAQDEEQDVHGF